MNCPSVFTFKEYYLEVTCILGMSENKKKKAIFFYKLMRLNLH